MQQLIKTIFSSLLFLAKRACGQYGTPPGDCRLLEEVQREAQVEGRHPDHDVGLQKLLQ